MSTRRVKKTRNLNNGAPIGANFSPASTRLSVGTIQKYFRNGFLEQRGKLSTERTKYLIVFLYASHKTSSSVRTVCSNRSRRWPENENISFKKDLRNLKSFSACSFFADESGREGLLIESNVGILKQPIVILLRAIPPYFALSIDVFVYFSRINLVEFPRILYRLPLPPMST